MLEHFRKFQYTFKNVLKQNYRRPKRNFSSRFWIDSAMAFSTDHGKFKMEIEGQNQAHTESPFMKMQKQNQCQTNNLAICQKEKYRQRQRQEEEIQRQRQRQRQEERQKQKQKIRLVKYLVGIAVLVSIYRQAYLPWDNERKFRNKYRKLPNVRYEYVQGSQVQKELNTIFQQYKQSQIKMIVGPQGSGKTSALMEILKRYDDQGKQFFYFTFQSSMSKDNYLKSADYLLKMLQMAQQMYQTSDYKNKEIKIVIDYINKIDDLDSQYFKKIMTQMYGFAYSQSIDLICLSSSSAFVEKFNNNNEYNKSVKTYALQSVHTEDFTHKFLRMKLEEYYRKTLKKELKKDESFWEDFKAVSKQIFSFGCNLIFIQLEICPLICSGLNRMEGAKTQNQISEILKEVKSIQSIEQEFDLLRISKLMKINFKNAQDSKQMIRKILQKEAFKLNNCLQVSVAGPEPEIIQKAIDQLNLKDLIMFCRPRTKRERTAFEKFLKKGFK